MDVDREIAAANARIRRQIDRSADAALARMDARWPSTTQLAKPQVERPANAGEWYGQYLRAWADAFKEFMSALERGFTAVDRAGGARR